MSTATLAAPTSSKALHYVLWGVQILLGLSFLMAGSMKATQPLDQLATNMNWVDHVPGPLVRFIGVSEFLGGLGLILPSALRIAPRLTPIAASLLALVMVLAAGEHLMIGEAAMAPVPLTLGAMAAFVAWGRFTRAPIAAR
jgi:putative oxidoreductase